MITITILLIYKETILTTLVLATKPLYFQGKYKFNFQTCCGNDVNVNTVFK